MSGLPKIQQIRDAEAALQEFIRSEAEMREAFMVDGLSKEEKVQLDAVKRKIAQLEAAIAKLRKEMEKNKAIWDKKAKTWVAYQDKAGKLLEFNHPGAEKAVRLEVDIKEAVVSEHWADATMLLGVAETEIAPYWKDYELQADAKKTFEPRFATLKGRWGAAQALDRTSEDLKAAMDQVAREIAEINSAVATPDYVKALSEMTSAKMAMNAVEALLNVPPPANLSGEVWFDANSAKMPTYRSTGDLAGAFKGNVEAFETALEAAGVDIDIDCTRRDPTRSAVMHYSWQVAKGAVAPHAVPVIAGIDVDFDHGDDAVSIAKAEEMKKCFRLAFKPSLTSLHESGLAIDWTLEWSGELKIKNKAGEEVVIVSSPKNGTNTDLHPVGASYGVHKLVGDAPHWSSTGG